MGVFKSIAFVAEEGNAVTIRVLGGSEAIQMLGGFPQWFGRGSCTHGGEAHHVLA